MTNDISFVRHYGTFCCLRNRPMPPPQPRMHASTAMSSTTNSRCAPAPSCGREGMLPKRDAAASRRHLLHLIIASYQHVYDFANMARIKFHIPDLARRADVRRRRCSTAWAIFPPTAKFRLWRVINHAAGGGPTAVPDRARRVTGSISWATQHGRVCLTDAVTAFQLTRSNPLWSDAVTEGFNTKWMYQDWKMNSDR